MKEYKILTQTQKWYSSKSVDPIALEQSLKELASQGWVVHSLVPIKETTMELFVVMEREVGTWG